MRTIIFSVCCVACGGGSSNGAADAAPSYAHDLGSLSESCAGNTALTGANALAMIGSSLNVTYTPAKDAGPPSPLTVTIAPATPLEIRCEPYAPAWIWMPVTAVVSTEDGTFTDDVFTGTLNLTSDASKPPIGFSLSADVALLHGTYKPHFAGASDDTLALGASMPPIQGVVMELSGGDIYLAGNVQ